MKRTKTEKSGMITKKLNNALEKGELKTVKEIIDSILKVNTIIDTNDETALCKAAENGHLNIVKYLISKRANVNHELHDHI